MAVLDDAGLGILIQKIYDADQEIKKSIPGVPTSTPKEASEEGNIGTSLSYAREDHSHPAQTGLVVNRTPIAWLVSGTSQSEGSTIRFIGFLAVNEENSSSSLQTPQDNNISLGASDIIYGIGAIHTSSGSVQHIHEVKITGSNGSGGYLIYAPDYSTAVNISIIYSPS